MTPKSECCGAETYLESIGDVRFCRACRQPCKPAEPREIICAKCGKSSREYVCHGCGYTTFPETREGKPYSQLTDAEKAEGLQSYEDHPGRWPVTARECYGKDRDYSTPGSLIHHAADYILQLEARAERAEYYQAEWHAKEAGYRAANATLRERIEAAEKERDELRERAQRWEDFVAGKICRHCLEPHPQGGNCQCWNDD